MTYAIDPPCKHGWYSVYKGAAIVSLRCDSCGLTKPYAPNIPGVDSASAPNKQRLIRVLVYEGTPEWIQECLSQRAVKGSLTNVRGRIKEAIVGDFLQEILNDNP